MSNQFLPTDADDELIAAEMSGHGAFESYIDSILQDDGTLWFDYTLSRALLSPT